MRKFTAFFVFLLFLIPASGALAETIYVDARNGDDRNPGTIEEPLRSLAKAAQKVTDKTESGAATIKIAPGTYNLGGSVVFDGARPYTEKERLVIEASILPDEPQWKPSLMPVILSTEDPRKQGQFDRLTETYGLEIGVSHVTIRGLKFLGNPLMRNWHCCLSRIGDGLDDLLVTQCMFIGSKDVADIYCAALATGDRFVVDHCIFRDCHACTVYWDGPQGIGGKGCAMRYCIVDGALIAGVWTCQTAEDFEFHHNIVTRGEYFWMRKRIANPRKYRVYDCIVTGNKNYSGYGVESGPTGRTGAEVQYDEKYVVKEGEIVLEADREARDYLHVADGGPGSELGAGLFTKKEKQD